MNQGVFKQHVESRVALALVLYDVCSFFKESGTLVLETLGRMTGPAPWGKLWGGYAICVGVGQNRVEIHQAMRCEVCYAMSGMPAFDASRHRVRFYGIIQLDIIANVLKRLITEWPVKDGAQNICP